MKKIVTAVAAIAMAASMFAVDFSATVKVKGDVVYGSGDTVTFFGVENTNQKDNDLLEVHFAGDKAGANFKFWTTAKEEVLKVRALNVWFQPTDWLKVTVGNNDLGLFTERVNWWKVPCGASAAEFASWDGRWASGAGVHENFGFTAELTPVDGLYIGLGASSDAITFKNGSDPVMNQMGAVAKYSISDIGLTIGGAFRYTPTFDLITFGAEYSKDAFFGFVQGKLRLDGSSGAYYKGNKDELKLAGITIDNYFSYNFGFMSLAATFPVTIRGLLNADDKSDPTYMTARVKATIPVDAITLYAVIGSDEGFNNGPAASKASTVWTLNDKFGDNFNFYGNVGATFNVGVCALDVGFEMSYDKPADNFAWAIPFSAQVAF